MYLITWKRYERTKIHASLDGNYTLCRFDVGPRAHFAQYETKGEAWQHTITCHHCAIACAYAGIWTLPTIPGRAYRHKAPRVSPIMVRQYQQAVNDGMRLSSSIVSEDIEIGRLYFGRKASKELCIPFNGNGTRPNRTSNPNTSR